MARFIVPLLIALALSLTLSGQGKSGGKGKGKAAPQSQDAAPAVVFAEQDQRILRDWVRATPAGRLPPGLAQRGDLPPGLQKQLQRKGTLPPGLQKRISPFPPELANRLRPLPPGCNCDRVFLDGRALIVSRGANTILDVVNLF
jgi:hypothetical protein